MKTLSSLDELHVLKNNSVEYKGSLPEYQQNGSKHKSKQPIKVYKFNQQQNLLYKRALFGLSLYTQEELKIMHWERKRRIKRVSKRAQESINLLKQERVNAICDTIYTQVFPKSKLAKIALSSEKIATDPKFINTLDLKSLGIDKPLIIKRLVTEGILPKNFYELKEAV